ncbi:hypothetical protein LZ30DRAFT_734898 [Colletotrichum cereale]|nr:hypothetical protein LZ30DRAFT_734898 [Colletotrichum cereale]
MKNPIQGTGSPAPSSLSQPPVDIPPITSNLAAGLENLICSVLFPPSRDSLQVLGGVYTLAHGWLPEGRIAFSSSCPFPHVTGGLQGQEQKRRRLGAGGGESRIVDVHVAETREWEHGAHTRTHDDRRVRIPYTRHQRETNPIRAVRDFCPMAHR